MNPKRCFMVQQNSFATDSALLFVRVVAGLALMIHGSGKIQAPFGWMGPEAPVPGILQALAAFSEFGGGLALILGLLTRLAALGITFTMVGAVATHLFVKGDPFVASGDKHGYELAAVYLTLAILFVAGGPGGLSLDRFLFGRK